MFHLLYLVAFAVVAYFAVSNLLRNIFSLGRDVRQGYGSANGGARAYEGATRKEEQPSHPELLDEGGKVLREPYLVMKSISVEDARERLDAIYEASPGDSLDDDDNGESTSKV